MVYTLENTNALTSVFEVHVHPNDILSTFLRLDFFPETGFTVNIDSLK